MSLPRFHVPGAAPGHIELPEDALAHATRVLRLDVGDEIRVFDAGREFKATLSAITKRGVTIDVREALPASPERAVALHLIMSPLKGDLTELVLQKATELGVARISPVVFERTDTVARRDPSEGRLTRWDRVMVGAAEQSGRAVVPALDPVQSLAMLLEALGAPSEGDLRIVAAEPSLEVAPAAAERRVSPTSEATSASGVLTMVRVAVGPAGGFSARDLDLLTRAGFRAERFALHTLRAETACVAALAILGERYL